MKQRYFKEVNEDYGRTLAELGLKTSHLKIMLTIDKPRIEAEIDQLHKKIAQLMEEVKHARKDSDQPQPTDIPTPEITPEKVEGDVVNG